MGRSSGPRIAPGNRAQTGRVNALIARGLGWAAGSGPPNLFTTLGRHRSLFRPWLRFAGALMPGGSLPRIDSEIVILRVADNCDCEYEWRHHERLGAEAGLSAAEIARVREGPAAAGWSPRQALILRAVDELHAARKIGDELWADLAAELREHELIELCMLAGHYEMLAMTINSLAIEPDDFGGEPPRIVRAVQARLARR